MIDGENLEALSPQSSQQSGFSTKNFDNKTICKCQTTSCCRNTWWIHLSVRALVEWMLAMTLNVLVHTTTALVEVVLLGDTVGTTMWHIIVVADSLLLLIPSTVTM